MAEIERVITRFEADAAQALSEHQALATSERQLGVAMREIEDSGKRQGSMFDSLTEKLREHKAEKVQEMRATRFYAMELQNLAGVSGETGHAIAGIFGALTTGSVFAIAVEGVKLLVEAFGEASRKTKMLEEAQREYSHLTRGDLESIADEAEKSASRTGKKFTEEFKTIADQADKLRAKIDEIWDAFDKAAAQKNMSAADKAHDESSRVHQADMDREQKRLDELTKSYQSGNLTALERIDIWKQMVKQTELLSETEENYAKKETERYSRGRQTDEAAAKAKFDENIAKEAGKAEHDRREAAAKAGEEAYKKDITEAIAHAKEMKEIHDKSYKAEEDEAVKGANELLAKYKKRDEQQEAFELKSMQRQEAIQREGFEREKYAAQQFAEFNRHVYDQFANSAVAAFGRVLTASAAYERAEQASGKAVKATASERSAAIAKLVQDQLAGIATMSAQRALFELAEGVANVLNPTGGFGANHFSAALMFGAIAGGAGVGAAAIGNNRGLTQDENASLRGGGPAIGANQGRGSVSSGGGSNSGGGTVRETVIVYANPFVTEAEMAKQVSRAVKKARDLDITGDR